MNQIIQYFNNKNKSKNISSSQAASNVQESSSTSTDSKRRSEQVEASEKPLSTAQLSTANPSVADSTQPAKSTQTTAAVSKSKIALFTFS